MVEDTEDDGYEAAAERSDKWSLGEPADRLYDSERASRYQTEQAARECAELTIPALFPPEGYLANETLPGNNQSVGAMLFSTLVSHLVTMAFPPMQPIVRFAPKGYRLRKDARDNTALWTELLVALSLLEVAHREKLQKTVVETAYGQYVSQLIVAGNALWRNTKYGSYITYRCDTYIVIRSEEGDPLITVLKRRVKLQGLDEDHREFIIEHSDPEAFKDLREWEREVDLYYCQKEDVDEDGKRSFCYWEEYKGHMIPDTNVETPWETPVMWPGWLDPVYGQNWGRSYCERYKGDLYSLEANASAGNDITAAAAWTLFLAKPGSATNIKQLMKTANLSIVPGIEGDITVTRSDKSADNNVVISREETIARRLARAFLTQHSVQRDGERVTAEEIQRLGRELEKGMGNLYSMTATGNQRPIILRAIATNEADDEDIPPLPQDYVDVNVITGTDALGANIEADNLLQWGGTMQKLFPKTWDAEGDMKGFGHRLAAYMGVRPEGLLKSPEQLQQDQQKAMLAQVIDKGTGPGIKALSDANLQNQQLALPQGQPQGAPPNGG